MEIVAQRPALLIVLFPHLPAIAPVPAVGPSVPAPQLRHPLYGAPRRKVKTQAW
jgi:hypothetical protein